MGKWQKTYRTFILLGFLTFLILPAIQKHFVFVDVEPLAGAIVPPEKGTLSLKNWVNGDYQKQTEKFIDESFGFRNLFIRTNNQLAFTLFNKAKANGVLIGKNKYLYEVSYLKAYNGWDYVGEKAIKSRVEKLRYLQDTLQKLNKQLIVVFAAGKGSFYPEFFPKEYQTKPGKTNYKSYVNACKKLGVNHIDFNAYFVSQKHKSKYPLYPKYGIHWSTYGMGLVADSIIRYIEKKRTIRIPHLYWNKVNLEDAKESDYDIGYGMNLLHKMTDNQMAYPVFQYENDSLKTKPRSLVISDSFFWGMFNFGISTVFTDNQFWYYNEDVYPDSYQTPLKTKEVNLKKCIATKDVIIIMATEANLPKLGWGFIERMYESYKNENI